MENSEVKVNPTESTTVCDCAKNGFGEIQPEDGSCTNANCPYKYLKSDEFTSEAFKVVIRNVNRHTGFKEFKRYLGTIGLQPHKIKLFRSFCFVSFGSIDERDNALCVLNQSHWKGARLRAKTSLAKPDPLLQKRNMENPDDVTEARRLAAMGENRPDHFDRIESLRDSVTSYWRLPYDPDQLVKKQDSIVSNLALLRYKLIKSHPKLAQHLPETNQVDYQGWSTVCPVGELFKSPVITKYRNKSELSIGYDCDNLTLAIGFHYGKYRSGSVAIGPYHHVNVLSDRICHVLECLHQFLVYCQFSDKLLLSSLSTIDPITHQGHWRLCLVRETLSGEVLLLLDVHPQDLTEGEVDELIAELKAWFSPDGHGASANLTGLFISLRKKSSDRYIGRKLKHILGRSYIEEECCGMKFRISIMSFFQTNTLAAEILYNRIAELFKKEEQVNENGDGGVVEKPRKRRILLDICCGTGTIALCLSKFFDEVIGVELLSEAVQDAKLNAECNGIKNVKFFSGMAEDVVRNVVSGLDDDCELYAVADPPRSGLHPSVVYTLRKSLKIEKIVYVSCNLEAAMMNFIDFARPTSKRYMGDPFVPTYAEGVDLFPQTPHVEVILVLERKKVDIEAGEEEAELGGQ